ncbi:MAG: hypothetical protein J5493_01785 [Lachnospiraceae bacterium]|nr:hypothetical protein [Lachnospiraceae bacterium]
MERKYPRLSSPITIGRITFQNRMFSTPMGGTDITNDGCIGPKSTAFYELRAKGGAAAHGGRPSPVRQRAFRPRDRRRLPRLHDH